MVLHKIKQENINICGKLEEDTLNKILAGLFPEAVGSCRFTDKGNEAHEQTPSVTGEEIEQINK